MSSLETSSSHLDGEGLLTLAAAQAPVILYTAAATDDFPLTFISGNAAALTGHTADEMLSDNGYRDRLIHPDDLSNYRNSCRGLEPGGETNCTYRLRAPDGAYRWFRDEMRLPAEQPGVLTGCMIEVGTEMAAADARAEQRQSYQEAVEEIDGGFCVSDGDGIIIACNTMLAISTGHGPDHFVGKPLRFLVEEILPKIEIFDGEETENSEAWVERMLERASSGAGRGAELRMRAGYWVRATFAPTPDGGQFILITNIHTQKKLEQEMRESAAQFRLLVESHPLPVIMIDVAEGRVVYESPAASTMLGREWSEELDIMARDFYADTSDQARLVSELRRTGHLRNKFVPFKRSDGTLFRVAINANLIMYQGREVSVASITDLTKEQDREQALARANETLEDAIESLSEGFALYDRDDRLVTFNSRYVDYNWPCEDMIKPGMRWEDMVRTGAKRDKYFENDEEMAAFIQNHHAVRLQGKTMLNYEYTQLDGRWFLCSKRPTRQGGMVVTLSENTEAKELERELRESARHFRMLVESHPLPVILVDVETGRVLYESPAASTMFGRDPHSDAEFKVQDLYADPNDRAQFLSDLRRTGELHNRPIHYKRSDGSYYWISCNSRLIMHEGREVHITSILDLTEQQERETALTRANETLEDAIESLSEGFALFDGDDRLVLCNSRYRDFNEICADIVQPGLLFEDLIRVGAERGQYFGNPDEIDDFVNKHIADRQSGSANFGFEYKQCDGRWFQYSSQPTRQGGTVVTLTDISKSKEMEWALRESEASVRQILESCPAPITVSRGHDSIILYESPASKKLFKRGMEHSNMVARDYWVDKSDRDGIWEELQEKGLVQDRTIQFIDGEGKKFWASYSGRMVENKGEKIMISAILDLTEYRALEQEMVRQREVLHVSEKMIAMGELLASVSHELNNPLSVVVGQALLLQETAEDPAIAARAERIVASADRCARIVKTFLSMARQQPRESSAANVNDLLELALEVAGYSLRASDIKIGRNLAQGLPDVLVDTDQIVQVFINLMVNAEQALREIDGPRRLTMTTSYRETEDEVVVKIKDNGPGIPDDIRRRIFEPFFTTKEVGDGTGIGLALCHRILQSHGGRIKLESAPGEGAAFVMRLPAVAGDWVGIEAQGIVDVGPARLSILIIDDEASVAELVADILEIDGHDTTIANNGKAGLALAKEHAYDIVLSDLRMPELDGPALFRRMQEDNSPHLDRIGFLTGDTLSKDMDEFLRESGRPYVEKPITPSDVRELILRILDGAGPLKRLH